MAYNANNLSKIVKEREKAENWLVYFQIKHKRNPAMRPMTKVSPCNHVICSVVAVHEWRILCGFHMSNNKFVSHKLGQVLMTFLAFFSKEILLLAFIC